MKVTVSSTRQAHYKLPVNWFAGHGDEVTFITSVPRNRMRDCTSGLKHRFVPAPATLLNGAMGLPATRWIDEHNTALYDWLSSRALGACNMTLSGSSGSLALMKAARKRGAVAVLDRACPHIRVQQDFLALEAEKAGGAFERN